LLGDAGGQEQGNVSLYTISTPSSLLNSNAVGAQLLARDKTPRIKSFPLIPRGFHAAEAVHPERRSSSQAGKVLTPSVRAIRCANMDHPPSESGNLLLPKNAVKHRFAENPPRGGMEEKNPRPPPTRHFFSCGRATGEEMEELAFHISSQRPDVFGANRGRGTWLRARAPSEFWELAGCGNPVFFTRNLLGGPSTSPPP